MKYYEKLYFFKDDGKFVQGHLADFLLFQIYSPKVLRKAYAKWPELPWFIRENVPKDIQVLIEKSPHYSDKVLRTKLNEYHIRQAVDVLSKYQACDVPMTQDPTVPQNRYKLTSKRGDKALLILQNALQQKQFSNKMADLAVHSTHKFLAEGKYYLDWKFPSKFARCATIEHCMQGDNSICYTFPAIQLTKGCMNHCSHCDSRAEAHLSHMPWPMFQSLHRALNKHYRHYPQNGTNHYFSQFFADSDMLDYHDPVMDVDSGDVGLWVALESEYCQYLTRGVKNERNRLSLAKALVSGQPVALSFVDTPREDMAHNLKQLENTLDVVESVPQRKGQPSIIHLHLKSGGSVDKKVFRDFPVEDAIIYALGRAKDFLSEEVNHFPDKEFIAPIVFEPNGSITGQKIKDAEISKVKLGNLFRKQQGPKISPVRLFIRRHILSRFR